MTTPKRTHEEIAQTWWDEWRTNYPDQDDSRDVERCNNYSADAVKALVAALREAEDAARQEERKALLSVRSKIDALAWHPSRDSSARAAWHWAVRLIDEILDARSRGEEKS